MLSRSGLRLYQDAHVLIERREHPAQALDGKAIEAALVQMRELRLRRADDRGGCALGEAARFDDVPDRARQVDFGGQLVGLGDSWRDQEHDRFRQEFEATM